MIFFLKDMKGVQPIQQPSEPMGNYMAYSYNQNKAYHQVIITKYFLNTSSSDWLDIYFFIVQRSESVS